MTNVRMGMCRGLLFLAGVFAMMPRGDCRAAASGIIREENLKEGALDWQLTRVRVDKNGRSPWIEGYCSRQSVLAGESVDIMVSTDPPAKFNIEIFRTGYYGGRGARLMKSLGPIQGSAQPVPPVGEMRLRECRWKPSASVPIPGDWVSGVYVGRLTTIPDIPELPYWQSYVIFIVRDKRRADVLFQCSDNTWQAYNQWPERYSLYTDPRGAHARDVAVSFDRPYGRMPQYTGIVNDPLSVGSGEFLCFEQPFAYFLEEHGYDVTYCANVDCMDASQVARCKAFLSIGHDEYWDVPQYNAVKSAIDSGVNALWFSGNSVFAVSQFSNSSDGRPNRIITRVGHFAGLSDEEYVKAEKTMTKDWRRAGPDETLIMGARTVMPANGGADWICTKPEHWIFEGTGMKKGDSIPGLVGWEHHGAPGNLPGLEIVAEGTAWSGGVTPVRWTATIFPGPKGNFVFNAATIFWCQDLSMPPGHTLPWSHWSRPHGPDKRVQKMTHNLLARAIGADKAAK